MHPYDQSPPTHPIGCGKPQAAAFVANAPDRDCQMEEGVTEGKVERALTTVACLRKLATSAAEALCKGKVYKAPLVYAERLFTFGIANQFDLSDYMWLLNVVRSVGTDHR